jgi:GTPase
MMIVRSSEDIVLFGKNIKEDLLPVFAVSNLNGANIEALRKFLNVLPVTESQATKKVQEDDVKNSNKVKSEFLINTKFFKDDLVVLAGAVINGSIAKKQKMYLGPDNDGKFRAVEIVSIHCYKVPVRIA